MKTILLIILLSVWAIVAIVEALDLIERRKIKRMEPAERMEYIAKKYGKAGIERLYE